VDETGSLKAVGYWCPSQDGAISGLNVWPADAAVALKSRDGQRC